MDWLYLALVAVMLAALLALFIGCVRVYINRVYIERRPRKPYRIRGVRGE